MKTCPYCGEKIQNLAKKCRYCGERLINKENDKKIKDSEMKEKKIKNEVKRKGKGEEKNKTEADNKSEGKNEKYLQKKANQFEFWYTILTLKRTLGVFFVCVVIISLISTWLKKGIPFYLILLISAIISALACYQDYLPKTREKAIEEHIERVKNPVYEKNHFPFAKIILRIILGFFGLLGLIVLLVFLRN